jgi:ABC-type branched-subunit amino acid transport system ATPase component
VFSVCKLSAGYGAVNILSNIDLHVEENESVAIIGANGAGKSTLVRAICGLLPTSSGAVLKDNVQIQGMAAYRRAEIGIAVVLENRHLFGEMTVAANLQLAIDRGATRKNARFEFNLGDVYDLFPAIKERADARVELLSGGEQQMVAIGRSLLLRPELLILDEPSTGLAPKIVRDIVSVISGLRKRGMSLLLIEQNVAVAVESSDRAYVLSLGRVIDHIEPSRWRAASTSEALARAYLGGN